MIVHGLFRRTKCQLLAVGPPSLRSRLSVPPAPIIIVVAVDAVNNASSGKPDEPPTVTLTVLPATRNDVEGAWSPMRVRVPVYLSSKGVGPRLVLCLPEQDPGRLRNGV